MAAIKTPCDYPVILEIDGISVHRIVTCHYWVNCPEMMHGSELRAAWGSFLWSDPFLNQEWATKIENEILVFELTEK
jgi:hypothetical protein